MTDTHSTALPAARQVLEEQRHPRTGRLLVVKRAADEQGTAQLDAAAALLGASDHPGILTVHDRHDDSSLVLPKVAGGSLAQRLARDGPLGERATAQLVLGLTDALDHLHRRALVHGDLSASNVLLHPDGQPVLADPSPPSTDLSGTTSTAGYAPPEVAAGARPGPSADLYALGVLGLECLGPSGSPALRTVLATAAHPDPRRRHASARALAVAVEQAVPGTTWLDRATAGGHGPASGAASEPTTRSFGPMPPRPQPREAPARSRRAVRWLVAVLAVGIAVGVTRLAIGSEPPACPATAATTGDEHAVAGDLDGDGCTEPVTWDEGRAVAGLPDGHQVQVGEPGDQLVLGDWDCDQVDTPALYRPGTGEVFEFPTWVTGDDALLSSETHETGVRDGTPTVAEPTGAGCDRVAVAP